MILPSWASSKVYTQDPFVSQSFIALSQEALKKYLSFFITRSEETVPKISILFYAFFVLLWACSKVNAHALILRFQILMHPDTDPLIKVSLLAVMAKHFMAPTQDIDK